MSTKKLQLIGTLFDDDSSANIDDTTPSATTTYSSEKIESKINELNESIVAQGKEVAKKANESELAPVSKSGSYKDLKDQPSIPNVPNWAMQETKPSYTASDVKADPVGTADTAVVAHNTEIGAHEDIRLLIEGLTNRLNALANSDDTTLDQLSEIVAYIKSNKALIDAITTNKVSVGDIVNNLTTNVANRPLSAAQGVALKALVDAIAVPIALSQLREDASHRVVTDAEKAAWNAKSNFSGVYADLTGKPIIPSALSQMSDDATHRTVTDAEKTSWNAKSDFSGNYNDLTNKPTIPTVPTDVSTFKNDAGYLTPDKLPEAIENELGYTPASEGSVSQLSEKIDAIGTQEEIVQQVIAALGTPVFGTVDENKHITLSGHLADGTYTIRFEDTDGYMTEVCTIEKGGVKYTNLVPTAEAYDSKAPYNGTGYKDGYYLSGSAPYEGSDAACVLTGYMPYTVPATGLPGTIYISGAEVQSVSHCRIYFFGGAKVMSGDGVQGTVMTTYFTIETMSNGVTKLTPIASGDTSKLVADNKANTTTEYFRMSLIGTGENLIITVNEPIV